MSTQHRPSDSGFTLVELLVVTTIITTLATIAIPIFLRHRQKAIDASMISDMRMIAQAEEGHFVSAGAYKATANVGTDADLATRMTPGNLGAVTLQPGGRSGAYCVVVSRVLGAASGSHPLRVYVSDLGGVQQPQVQSCV